MYYYPPQLKFLNPINFANRLEIKLEEIINFSMKIQQY
jgi:hypothetical protein